MGTWGNEDKHGNPLRAGCLIEIIQDQELPSRHRRYHLCAGYMPGIKVRWPNGDFTQYFLKDLRSPTQWFVCGEAGPPYYAPELVLAQVSFTLSGDPCRDARPSDSYERRRRSVRGE